MYRLTIAIIIVLIFNQCEFQKQEQLPPPNIVWLLSEDNSIHYLKMYDENGIATPQIEKMAEQGIKFNNAFSNAPVCSVARTTLISGCYGPRIGTQYHRKSKPVPMPDDVKMFPAYLREAGYYTTNNHKEDYNAIKTDEVWDESSNKAHWRNRQTGQPFFHQQNIGNTHESQLHFDESVVKNHQLTTNPDSVFVAPVHPNTDLFRFTNAYYRDRMLTVDEGVAKVIKQLEEDGLLENTFIFYFGDHGGVLPGSKGYIHEVGMHVPLVVRIPEKYKRLVNIEKGTTVDGFVSFVDFGPTLLHLAGLEVPEGMDGTPFLSKDVSVDVLNESDEAFGYADRFDEKYDLVRSIRKGNYKYLRNFQPFNPDGLYNEYRYKMLAYQEWLAMFKNGELNEIQSRFFLPKQVEELYDVEQDPYETNNLADDPAYAETLREMRNKLMDWVKSNNDLSFYPESELIKNAFDNPVAFGKNHHDEISNLVDIANLSLSNFEEVKEQIKSALESSNPFERYWGLIVCSSFGKEALELSNKALELAKSDDNLLVRTRAAEFLALYANVDPKPVFKDVLAKTKDGTEANLILNSVVLLMDSPFQYNFDLTKDLFDPEVLNNEYVTRRMNYILERQKELRFKS